MSLGPGPTCRAHRLQDLAIPRGHDSWHLRLDDLIGPQCGELAEAVDKGERAAQGRGQPALTRQRLNQAAKGVSATMRTRKEEAESGRRRKESERGRKQRNAAEIIRRNQKESQGITRNQGAGVDPPAKGSGGDRKELQGIRRNQVVGVDPAP